MTRASVDRTGLLLYGNLFLTMANTSDNEQGDDTPEGMRYGMLGNDRSPVDEKLDKYTGDVDWVYLQPHFDAGSLVYVDPGLTLKLVGQAFTQDDRQQVEAWFKSGDLVKPSQPHAAHWSQSKSQFMALVVSPFVLITPLES